LLIAVGEFFVFFIQRFSFFVEFGAGLLNLLGQRRPNSVKNVIALEFR